ncbi:DUF805 domain-containing protein [Veillonella agrestimuris]|uniref:DUF805 domain-containing protein n=1 Tax=Veillonella agrestimuris TaxID=2941340 RepID=UPI00203F8E4A|nr:DUF805 domain-containing protein [Veillonella agrestimuris]
MKYKYATASGRASRKEYWSFVLCSIMITFIAMILDEIWGTKEAISKTIYIIFLIPSLTITIRRLHDINKSGFWYLIQIIPVLGTIYLLYLMIKPTQPNDNQYGSSLLNK